VVETIDNSLSWIKEYLENPESKKIKNIGIVDEAIAAYLTTRDNKEG